MSRIKAEILRDFETPESDETLSTHGAQREDAIITSFLAGSGWGREASAAAKAAFLPDVVPVKEGNGRGRGATLIDAFRVNPKRACGGDFLSLKAPTARKSGEFPSSVELFKGTRSTLICCLEAIKQNHKNGKAFPLAVVHTGGEVFAPTLVEWAILDFGTLISEHAIVNKEGWETYADIPVKPLNDRPRGRGGSPASVWITLLRREKAGCVHGVQKYRYAQDDDGHYATLATSVSARSGTRFIAGSPADFAMDVDAATVLR